MNLFQRSFKDKHSEDEPEKKLPENELTEKKQLSASEAANYWFERHFGQAMPEELKMLFQDLAKIEARKIKAGTALLSEKEIQKIKEQKRLYETKLTNTEDSLDRIRQQMEWYRSFIALRHNLNEEKDRLYKLNKEYSSILNQIQALERFESFEDIQENFQRIHTLRKMLKQNRTEQNEIAVTLDKIKKEYNKLVDELTQTKAQKEDLEDQLYRTEELLVEGYKIEGSLKTLGLKEKKETELKTELEKNFQAQKKTLTELETEIATVREKLNICLQERQGIDAHRTMLKRGEEIQVKLDNLYSLQLQKDEVKAELDATEKKQNEQNELLNKLFTESLNLDAQISRFQNELRIHQNSNYGQDSSKLQERTMMLKGKIQRLQTAQTLWSHISQGYNYISEKKLEISRLNIQTETIRQNIEQLTAEVKHLKIKTEELNYAYTLSKSQNVILLRSDLREGTNCSVCGATHHPYHSDTMLEQSKLISDLKTDYEQQANEYKQKANTLAELQKEFATEQGKLETESKALADYIPLLQQNIREWDNYKQLDRSFADCSPSTNQEARRSMLQQLIERTTQDAEKAQQELEQFNYHQEHINRINENIAEKESAKNDIIVRLNEVNTGCQVMANNVERLQKRLSDISTSYSELYEELDRAISLSDWYRIWKHNHETLKVQMQQMLQKWKNEKKEIVRLQQIQAVAEAQYALQTEHLQYIQQQIESNRRHLESTKDMIKEYQNSLSKISDGKDVKSMYLKIFRKITELKEKEKEQEKVYLDMTNALNRQLGRQENMEAHGKILEDQIAEEQSELDIWMRKYNANHSPVQFSELEQVFTSKNDWQSLREKVRTLHVDMALSQKRVDNLQAELGAHQADGLRPSDHDEDTTDILINRKEQLEQTRRDIACQIAALDAKLKEHEMQLDIQKTCTDSIIEKTNE